MEGQAQLSCVDDLPEQRLLFDRPNPVAAATSQARSLMPRVRQSLGYVAIVVLVSAATGVMMLCPCDLVGIHDHYAISLVAIALSFSIAAAYLVYRRMRRDSGITGFLRAVIALAIVGFSVCVELYAAMEVVTWLARRR